MDWETFIASLLSSGLICSIEDDGAGDGGGGDGGDGGEQGGDTPSPGGGEGSDGGDDSETTYTAADLEKARERAKNEAWKEARKKYGRKPGPKPKGDQNSGRDQPASSQDDLREELRLRDDFADVTDGMTITPKQRKALRKAFFAERPHDAESWMEDMVEAFGIGKGNESTQPENPEPKDPPKPKGPPKSDGGSPGADRDPNQIRDPRNLTNADRQRIYEEHGVVKGDQIIRDMVRKYKEAHGR